MVEKHSMISSRDKRACLIFSGGLDSTTLLYFLLDKGYNTTCLSFQYGQLHGKELHAAQKITEGLGVPHYELHVPIVGVDMHPRKSGGSQHLSLFKGSSQTDSKVPVPEGHYAEESMKKTVVPNRNMIMLSLASAFCISYDIKQLFYGAHAGDHAIYPDCRPDFVSQMQIAIKMADYEAPELNAPFLFMTKRNIVDLGVGLDVPFERTWSCYKGGNLHCGKCGTCVERKEAFQLAGVVDPTKYEQ